MRHHDGHSRPPLKPPSRRQRRCATLPRSAVGLSVSVPEPVSVRGTDPAYGFGMWIVLLIISDPDTA